MRVPHGTADMLFRENLSIKNMIQIVHRLFEGIADWRTSGAVKISLPDALMSALAVFGLKCESLLQFDEGMSSYETEQNIKNLYLVSEVPSDTRMREILDQVDPKEIKKALKVLFALAQRDRVLEGYRLEDGSILISVDGTGFFSSKTIRCASCCEKEHKDGSKTYYHQILSAVVISPNKREALPIGVEAIVKQDGTAKNDCERNAAKRLLQDLRREHPHLQITITEDGLASNGPHIHLLKELSMSFILGCKADDHLALFETMADLDEMGGSVTLIVNEGAITKKFKFANDLALNESHSDLRVNFLEYWETNHKSGKKLHFSWVTDKPLSKQSVNGVMLAGRARWRIENETFNTLKNQGYNFEHNYGHGSQNLSSNLAILMMTAFMIDELQKLACPVFAKLRSLHKTMKGVWRTIRSGFSFFVHENWLQFYLAMIAGRRIPARVARNAATNSS